MKTKLRHSGFCVLRIPAFSIESIKKIPHGKNEVSEFIKSQFNLLSVREAIYIASSSLYERIEEQIKSPDGIRDDKLINSFIKYYLRMASRSTPFGGFSGVGYMNISENENIEIVEPITFSKSFRLCFSVLNIIKERIESNIDYLPSLKLHVNDTLIIRNNKGFYIDYMSNSSTKKYHVSSVDIDIALECILDFQEKEVTFTELQISLKNKFPSESYSNIKKYIFDLVKEKVLLSNLELPIQSEKPDVDFIEKICKLLPHDFLYKKLNNLLFSLNENKDKKFGHNDLARLKKEVEGVIDVKHKDFFQVDSFLDSKKFAISDVTVMNLIESIPFIEHFFPGKDSELEQFIKNFNSKFEGRFIPILEALNDEFGISQTLNAHNSSDLLAGTYLGKINSNTKFNLNEFIAKITPDHKDDIDLETLIDFSKIHLSNSLLPRSFAAMVSIYGDDKRMVKLHGFYGPSAANLIGRFCYLDDSLSKSLRSHLDNESNNTQDVVYAEVVHLPGGKVGNIVCRPKLRDYSINILSSQGADGEHSLKLSDIYVFIRDGIVKLWSRKLDKEVIPRLSVAHNFNNDSIGIYRFLCMIQNQSSRVPAVKIPESFSDKNVIPRIVFRNIILSPKHWLLDTQEIIDTYHKFGDISSLIKKYGIDQHICVGTGDNMLTIDIYNKNLIPVLISEIKGKNKVRFAESLDMSLGPAVKSNHERYSHEIIIPIVNDSNVYKLSYTNGNKIFSSHSKDRYKTLGSEWISLKLYASENIIEDIIGCHLPEIILNLGKNNYFLLWFYVRYYDNEKHVRVRFKVRDEDHIMHIIKIFNSFFREEIESRIISRIEFFTYEREIERYGGVYAIEHAEKIFMHDSNAALSIVSASQSFGDYFRLRCLISLIDSMLKSFGLNFEASLDLISKLRHGFSLEFDDSKDNRKQFGIVFKKCRLEISSDLLDLKAKQDDKEKKSIVKNITDSYAKNIENSVYSYNNFHKEKLLSIDLNNIISSFIHMSCNRVFKQKSREHEFLVYDLMRRSYIFIIKNPDIF